VRTTLYLFAVVLIAASSCSSSDSDEETGAAVADSVMAAWASGDQADIDDIYAEDVVMALDGMTVAESREEIASVITTAIGIGNTYRQVGPVAVYVAEDGDMYVSSLVEVVGIAHQVGDPVVGFYRVRDGQVIRHIFMDAENA
jgi:uncharacterized protein (TIGR02246 family)